MISYVPVFIILRPFVSGAKSFFRRPIERLVFVNRGTKLSLLIISVFIFVTVNVEQTISAEFRFCDSFFFF